jgi:branched-chain amino acid transport system ATP-binding protein
VEENLSLAASFGVPADELKDRAYTLFPRLAARRRQRAGQLSGGEQQMLSLGRALASRPSVLLIDEVSMGLAPKIVTEIYAAVTEAATAGTSILLVEQYAERALAVAQTAAVMQSGRIVATGEPDEIRRRLKDLYLG